MKIEIRTDVALGDWFSEISGDPVQKEGTQFFGLVVNGEIRSVFAFGRFMGGDVEMGVLALPGTRWPRAFLKRMYDYIFVECRRSRVTLHAKDEHAASMMERIGAVREAFKPHAYGHGRHAIVMAIFPENFKVR